MNWRMRILFFSFTLISCVVKSGELTIVNNGKSSYCIVVNPQNPGAAKVAAKDLQEYIHKATRVVIPIVKESERQGRPAFLLGYGKVNKPEGFIVKTSRQDVIISGDDTSGVVINNHWRTGARVGTWYGVCDFLEKQLGIRWFMPGELGEYVPVKNGKWTIPELNYEEFPLFEMRRMSMYTHQDKPKKLKEKFQNELFKWQRRNRVGNAESWCAWHIWLYDIPGHKYFDKHPDWFALVNGKRYGIDPLGLGLKICTTNSEVLDFLANILIKRYKNWDGQKGMLALSPNDGGFFCECEKCIALDDGFRVNGSRIMSSRIMTYANEIAKRVLKKIPEAKFGIYAYGLYVEGVSKVKLHPSITVEEVLNDTGLSYYNKDVRKRHLDNLKAWRKVLNKLYYYSTPEGMGNLNLPVHQFHNIKMLYDNLYAADVSGIDMNNYYDFGSTGLNNYFYLKMCWSKIKDSERFYDQTLKECFGDIAFPVVKQYFEDLEQRLAKVATVKLDENLAMGFATRFPQVLTIVYPGLAEKWLPLLKQASLKTQNIGQKARLDMITENLQYTGQTVKLFQLASKFMKGQKVDSSIIVQADNLAKTRENLRSKWTNNILFNARPSKMMESKDLRHNMPFDRNAFKFMMSNQARKKTFATRIKTAPNLDGNINEEVWKNIKSIRIELSSTDAKKRAVGAEAKIAVTNDALYLCFCCNEPFMNKIKDGGVGEKAAVWNENNIDLFLDVTGNGKKYYQLIFNTLGTSRSFIYQRNKAGKIEQSSWQSNAVIKTSLGKNAWFAEVKIPLSNLVKKADIRGDIWGVNFCRCRQTVHPAEYSCWSPTFGNFNIPERFGKLIIK